MKLNLGCGKDVRDGYVNVDFFHTEGVNLVCDLSVIPWNFKDESADEIIMLDFLEHFSYNLTKKILSESYRIIKFDGFIDVQVPDFGECARAFMNVGEYHCNRCGNLINSQNESSCNKCNHKRKDLADAARNRIFGGQDRNGNWHYNAFTYESLCDIIKNIGFSDIFIFDKNENNETYRQNWNMKIRAYKRAQW